MATAPRPARPARNPNQPTRYYGTNMPAPAGAPALTGNQFAQRYVGKTVWNADGTASYVPYENPVYVIKDPGTPQTPGRGIAEYWRSDTGYNTSNPGRPNAPTTPAPGGGGTNPPPTNGGGTTTPPPTNPAPVNDGLFDWQRTGNTPEFGKYLNSQGVVDLAAWFAAKRAQMNPTVSIPAGEEPFQTYLRQQGVTV